MEKEKLDDIVNWYVTKRPHYKNLAKKVESIIKEVLDSRGISYYLISSRAKEINSFKVKASNEKYKDPMNEIKDLAGIRVITFVKSEVEQCCEVIKPLFDIDIEHSVDKSIELGNDKVGYRSVHFVAKLTDQRLSLPEYQIFKDMCFEIQVRTILEHAWADISHERNYKFKGVLPREIQRRFSLAAATLELIDREFDSLAKDISNYEKEIEEKAAQGNLDTEVNTTSLRNYLSAKFRDYIENHQLSASFADKEEEIIKELNDYGITRLDDLNKLIMKISEFEFNENNFLGLLRDIMIVNDWEKYFISAWERDWKGIDRSSYNYYKKMGVNINKVIKQFGLELDDQYVEEHFA